MSILVNGVEITDAAIEKELPRHQLVANPEEAAARALIIRELLLERAKELGLSVTNLACANQEERENAIIELLMQREVQTPEPTDAECENYYRNHLEAFCSGELVEASHILFQVNERTPLDLLRDKANEVLKGVLADSGQFETCARQYSNCSSAEQDGNLGQLTRGQTVPEFEAAVFALQEGQTASRLVETRFGLHIVRVNRRVEGRQLPFDLVKDKIAEYLGEQVRQKAIRQYLQILVGGADIHGFEMGGAQSPLVQ